MKYIGVQKNTVTGKYEVTPDATVQSSRPGFYKWHLTQSGSGERDVFCSFDRAPASFTALQSAKRLYGEGWTCEEYDLIDVYWGDFVRVNDDEFTYTYEGDPQTATRVLE